jgi:phosphoribosyl-dephospho-CoA transferase
MSNNVFSVSESTVNKILVCGTTITVSGPIKEADLKKAAKDAGMRNFVLKNETGEDLFMEDLPYEGTVKIVEYNAAKARDGVFSVTPTVAVVNKILVCGTTISVSGPIKEADLKTAAKNAGMRNFVLKNEAGEDIFMEDLPYKGTVKIVEYNAAKLFWSTHDE